MKQYTLGQLAWVRTIGFFRDDARKDMKALGFSADAISALTTSGHFRDANIVALYHDYGNEFGQEIEQYIDFCLKSYKEGWPHA